MDGFVLLVTALLGAIAGALAVILVQMVVDKHREERLVAAPITNWYEQTVAALSRGRLN